MNGLLDVFYQRKEELYQLFLQHMEMTAIAVLLSVCIGIPLGILITKNKKASGIVIGTANLMQSIPSIGLLAFLVPIVGIGEKPAIIMVIIYALLPIIKNTYIGITGIDPLTVESANGIGLSKMQSLFQIRIPIAMPYIMAGIRISAVTAVGTVTIAAFAGAGGLGWFINLGLNANDPDLVLLGAIPACLLALVVDFILGKAEAVLTPEGLKAADKIHYRTRKEQNRRIAGAVVFFVIIFLFPVVHTLVANLREKQDTLVVGSENFTEAIILGNIYSQLIQNQTDIQVEERFNLNGTMITMSAMENGDIDTFTDYTGVLAPNVLGLSLSENPENLYETVKEKMLQEYSMEVSQPLGFSNTYVFAVTRETSEKYGITKLSQLLEQAGELRLGCTTAFTQREDLLPKLQTEYQTEFKSVDGLEGNIRYQAISSGKVEVVDAFETDAILMDMDLVKIEDDIEYFPPYEAVAVTREDCFQKFPELREVMETLEGEISTEDMTEMNYKVDIEGKTPKETAIEFLKEKNLIE